ncbi:hypothetical protein RB608_01560 [Nocardioides sp. LHD-245]|uniref:hypothetical protein n=1 Tax=Nocardioides sp. LHD-245 TaxID=3051387 RepID=UPI0027E10921|nr:hypothetical protein [Nocardioides sp. LHD-245]
MHALAPVPRRLPQRVVVAGSPGEQLSAYLTRLAAALDVPLVPLAELSGPAEVARLAAFDGWVTTADEEWARPQLLGRAELLLQVELEAAGFAGRVRRTLRRIRSEARAPDLGWVASAPFEHPGLEIVRLPDADAADRWLRELA